MHITLVNNIYFVYSCWEFVNYYDKYVFMETVHPLFTYYDQCVTTLQLYRDYPGTGSVRGGCVHQNKK